MKWSYESLRRLIGRRIETATLKSLADTTGKDGQGSGLVASRLFLTLDNGESWEAISNGWFVTQLHAGKHSILTMRGLYKADYAPVVEAAADPDQSDGIRFSPYRELDI